MNQVTSLFKRFIFCLFKAIVLICLYSIIYYQVKIKEHRVSVFIFSYCHILIFYQMQQIKMLQRLFLLIKFQLFFSLILFYFLHLYCFEHLQILKKIFLFLEFFNLKIILITARELKTIQKFFSMICHFLTSNLRFQLECLNENRFH